MKEKLLSKATSFQAMLSNSSRIQNHTANTSRLLKGVWLTPSLSIVPLSTNLIIGSQAQQHGVTLSLMPNGMSKRTSNTTRYHKNVSHPSLLTLSLTFLSQIDKLFWKVHIIFVLNGDYSPSSLLQYDLNGLNSNASLLGLVSSNEMAKSLRNSSVDEEMVLSEMTSQFLSTTSVRDIFSLVSLTRVGSTCQQTPLEVFKIQE
jgi:hypothetical protein